MPSGDANADVSVGEVIGGYRLERLLGAGSTSHVYLGTHVRLGRSAAIKVLSQLLLDNKDVVSRLLQEARVVNDIRHPNIIDIVDFVETESPPRVALVMEYIEGPSLKALRDHPLTFEQALGIALQLVVAVQAAHGAGVIHRDIKPDNLLLTRDPRSDAAKKVPRLKVVDFGIAKLAGSSGRTVTGMMLGTPAYMAPEQVAGRPAPSAATDVFAIGEVLYELVSGKRAYPAMAIHETVRAKLRGELPPLDLPPALPGREVLQPLITRCLALRPQDRPTLDEVRDRLVSLAPQGEAGSRARREGASIMRALEPPTSQWLSALQEDIGAPLPELAPLETPGPRADEITGPSGLGSSSAQAPTDLASPLNFVTAELPAPSFPVAALTEVAPRIPVDHSSPTNRVLEALTSTEPLPSSRDITKDLPAEPQLEPRTALENPALTAALERDQVVNLLEHPTIEVGMPELARSAGSPHGALGAGLLQPAGVGKEGDRRPSDMPAAPLAALPTPGRRSDPRPEPWGEPRSATRSEPGARLPALAAAPAASTMNPPAQPRAKGRRRGLVFLIASLWLLASALIYLALSLDRGPPGVPAHDAAVTGSTPPAAQALVHLSVHSVPSGARVEDAPSGRALGQTPLELDLERARSPKRLRIVAAGYEPVEVDVLQANTRISVELEKLP